MFFYRFIYNIIIHVGNLFLAFRGHSDPKIAERKNNVGKLLAQMPVKANGEKRIWFHASSMGEFEQAKPIIEKIKAQAPNIKIFCSFFSPSGYLNQRHYEFADYVFYMPIDTKSKAKSAIAKIQPDLVVFVRYDVWMNHLVVLKKLNIPTFLICASYPSNVKLASSALLKPFTRYIYSHFDKIYAVSKLHGDLFRGIGVKADIIDSSDTRLDRISSQVAKARVNPIIPIEFTKDTMTLVAGSTWEKDENLLIEALKSVNKPYFRIRMILVPHEPTIENIERLQKSLKNHVLLSSLNFEDIEEFEKLGNNHIIVDSIGKLLFLYANADFAYVGNGFGKCVHSTSEPAGYGLPIATGPNISGSPDATELHRIGALEVIENVDELYNWLNMMLENLERRSTQGDSALKYVNQGKGEADLISKDILGLIANKKYDSGLDKKVLENEK
jgi:3-deoxy-D-manno-octulosonic-acid transferase